VEGRANTIKIRNKMILYLNVIIFIIIIFRFVYVADLRSSVAYGSRFLVAEDARSGHGTQRPGAGVGKVNAHPVYNFGATKSDKTRVDGSALSC